MKTHCKGPFLCWYDRSLRLWTCIMKDINENQVGKAGYGVTKDESIEDCLYINQYCGYEYKD